MIAAVKKISQMTVPIDKENDSVLIGRDNDIFVF
jgi:hypothetical protein